MTRVVKGVHSLEPSPWGIVAPSVLYHRRTHVMKTAAEHSMVVTRLADGRRWRSRREQRREIHPLLVANHAVQIIRRNGTCLVVQTGGDVPHARVAYARHDLSHADACGAVDLTADSQTLLQCLHVFSFGTNSVFTMCQLLFAQTSGLLCNG